MPMNHPYGKLEIKGVAFLPFVLTFMGLIISTNFSPKMIFMGHPCEGFIGLIISHKVPNTTLIDPIPKLLGVGTRLTSTTIVRIFSPPETWGGKRGQTRLTSDHLPVLEKISRIPDVIISVHHHIRHGNGSGLSYLSPQPQRPSLRCS